MRRDVGGFRVMATLTVRVFERGNPAIAEARSRGVPICEKLTDSEPLDREFPTVVPGTPYALFSSAQEEIPEAVVVVDNFAEQADQARYEAALGMLDNLIYR